MTAKVVNLRQIRKRKAREENARTGDTNAARFGESKIDRLTRAKEDAKAQRDLDGHKRDP